MLKFIVLAVIVVAIIGLANMFQSNKSATPDVQSRPDTVNQNAREVRIKNYAFQPAVMTVAKGETVTWINDDEAKHTVTSRSDQKLSSPLLAKGESFSYTFTEAGKIDYICDPHPYMKAAVEVK